MIFQNPPHSSGACLSSEILSGLRGFGGLCQRVCIAPTNQHASDGGDEGTTEAKVQGLANEEPKGRR